MPECPETRPSSSSRADESSSVEPVVGFGRDGTLLSQAPAAALGEPLPRHRGHAACHLESDRFTGQRVIGRGGSSVVVRAFDTNMQRDVAVKILAPEFSDGVAAVERFAEEARIAGQLEHPNILPVYEFGRDRRGRRFLCMRLVEGKTLEEALKQAGDERFASSRLAEFLEMFVKVCDAVSFAHGRGVIHRDLKPTNIMIGEFGQVYVLDWGIARLLPHDADRGPGVLPRHTRVERADFDTPGALVGTACYMAPEQIHGLHDELDERTDVFALGATLYQILTGQPPLTADIVRAIWMRKEAPPIASPDLLVPAGRVPADLSRIVLRATAYDPADRYASVADLKREVEAFQRVTLSTALARCD
jgi:serine/threonine protein kinase